MADISSYIDRMKQMGHQVIVRMLHDIMKCEPLAEKAIPGFDLNTVTFEVIGLVSKFISFFQLTSSKDNPCHFFCVKKK